MTAQHPEFAEEQAFIDHAYVCLEESRADALKMREFTTTGPGGTHQARFERNAVDEQLVGRLEKLDLGDSALVFGRIDAHGEGRLKEPPLLYSSRHGWRITGDKAREPGVSIRDQLLARLGDEAGGDDDGDE